jgi:hypothetical protein
MAPRDTTNLVGVVLHFVQIIVTVNKCFMRIMQFLLTR